MNVLVIGGNGFIGSHLIDHLLINKHKVRVFDSSYERYRRPLIDVDYRIARLDNITGLYEAMLGIDIVFHLASASVPSTSNIDQISDVNGNLIPTLHILNAMCKVGIKKIVYFSSGGAIYGNTNQSSISENSPLQPISSYGINKLAVEHYILLYSRLYDLDYLIIRPSNPYGPRQGHFIAQGVISTFLKKALAGEKLLVYGDGSSTKDYLYIRDLIDILYRLVARDVKGIFNIGSGSGTTLASIIEEITQVTGVAIPVEYSAQKSYDVSHFVLDITKVKSIVGPVDFTTLRNGIAETWEWIKMNDLNRQ